MKIKQEKRSFSKGESESDRSEPKSNKLISPSQIKVEAGDASSFKEEAIDDGAEEAVDDSAEEAVDDGAEEAVDDGAEEAVDDGAEAAVDDGAEEQPAGEQRGLEKVPHAFSGEGNIKALEKILNRTFFPGLVEFKLKKYFKEFSHVKPLPPARSWVDIDLANPDEDTWIVQCPASVDIQSELLNKKLNLSAPRTRIKHCSNALEAHVKHNSNEQAIGLMCGTQVKSFCPAGFVRITAALDDAPVKVELPTESSHVEVPFPEDIRQRHPLLGYDFQETVAMPGQVRKRLARAQKQAALFYTDSASAGTPTTSKPKSKRIKQEPETVPVKLEPEIELEMDTVPPKKSKKRKAATEENVNAAERFPSPNRVIKLEKPPKKSKHDKKEYNTSSIKKELAVEDDIAWLLNI